MPGAGKFLVVGCFVPEASGASSSAKAGTGLAVYSFMNDLEARAARPGDVWAARGYLG